MHSHTDQVCQKQAIKTADIVLLVGLNPLFAAGDGVPVRFWLLSAPSKHRLPT